MFHEVLKVIPADLPKQVVVKGTAVETNPIHVLPIWTGLECYMATCPLLPWLIGLQYISASCISLLFLPKYCVNIQNAHLCKELAA